MRRLTPFLEDFLAASLDLESDLAALPKPEGREAEWRRALRLEAGVLVPTVRDALRAARRGDGERASAKLNGLGVVIGDLKGLYAGVGLKICSA